MQSSTAAPSEATSPPHRLRDGVWPAWLALACSLALTFGAWRYSQREIDRQMRLEFDAEVTQVRADLNTRIAGYTQTLRAAAALFATADKVTREDWRDYIAGLRLDLGYPAIQAVAFAREVNHAELDALIREVRQGGLTDFAMRPPGRRDRYVINVYTEPYVGLNIKALGYDMWQDADRRETMRMARAAGDPMITRKITLKIDEQVNPVPAFIMYMPVVRKPGVEVYGYVLSPFRMPALMEDLLRKTPRAVALSIHDGTEPSADNLFYRSGDDTGLAPAKFVRRETKVVGGRTWTLTYSSRPDLETRGDTGRSAPVLAGGLLASLLLFGMVWSLATTRARALRWAGTMTSSLRESEQSLAITLHSIGDAVIATDPEGRVTRMNSAAERLSGWPLAEARNRPLAEVFHIVNADTRETITDPVHLVITHGQQIGLANHTLLLSRDGREYQISDSAAPIRNPAGDIVGAVLVFSDVTEKYRIEAALRESRKQYLNLVEGTPDLVTKVDLKGRFVFVNSSSAEFFGLPPDQCIGRSAFDFIAPDDHAATIAAFDRWLASGEEISKFENRQVGVDGRVHSVAWLIRAERDETGTLTGFASTGRDVSERKRTEEALRIAATAFESQEGMSITNAEGVILRINKAFTEITGYGEDEVLGRNPRLLKSNRQDPAFYTAMWNSLKQGGVWQGEIWNRRKNGEVYPEWLSITAVKDDAGVVTHYVGSFTDITSRKLAQDEIMHLAFYDPLTRLPNRRLLLDRLKQALASSTRNKRYGSLLFIDLDNFKTLNDTLGHDIGDLLLQQVGERLTTCVREGDTVARLGGDEFVVMLEDLSENIHESATQTETVGEKILATLNKPYQLASYLHHSTPSIGVTLFADHQESLDELLKRADLAMYQAKAAGRNTLRFFDPGMQSIVTARAALEADLRDAVLKSQFVLYYQAQVVGEGRKTGAEALVRWLHPQRGMVSPAEFIPLAEDTGLILPLGQWVLQTACDQLAQWADRPEMAHLTIAVNISARQFHGKDFVDQVTTVLDRSGANPQRLKLELTESLLVHDVEDVIAKMAALKAKGVGFSLDDFGTGYSSLSYLKRLPLDQLKIDQGFVRDILTDPNDAAIALMVVALAESLGLAVIAEGVEIETQRDFLARHGCHSYQGYLFSRPLPVDEFEEYVKRIVLP